MPAVKKFKLNAVFDRNIHEHLYKFILQSKGSANFVYSRIASLSELHLWHEGEKDEYFQNSFRPSKILKIDICKLQKIIRQDEYCLLYALYESLPWGQATIVFVNLFNSALKKYHESPELFELLRQQRATSLLPESIIKPDFDKFTNFAKSALVTEAATHEFRIEDGSEKEYLDARDGQAIRSLMGSHKAIFFDE